MIDPHLRATAGDAATVSRALSLSVPLHSSAPQNPPGRRCSDSRRSPLNNRLMNVGFRPRLKARPSLYDLIQNWNIDRLSATLSPTKLVDFGELPALPTSRPSTPIIEKHPEAVHNPVKMPPKKASQNTDADDDEQYGMSHQRLCGSAQANDSSPGSIYSVSGYAT